MSEENIDIYPDLETKPKIGIVGMGLVGEAIFEGFQSKGYELMVNDIRDLSYHIHTLEEIVGECGVIFVCVPTPSREDGSCDLSIVYDVFNKLHFSLSQLMRNEAKEPPVIVIKSTVIPGTADSLIAMYPYVCSNPEFMTEKNALRDFLNPDRIIIGAKSERVRKVMGRIYEDFDAKKIICSPTEAETIKYLSNSLLLTKVAFSQEISILSQMLRLNAKTVFEGVTSDKRIDPHHLDPTMGRVSTHTPCLSKDMMALIIQLEKSGHDSTFLKSAYATAVDGVSLIPTLKIKEDFR